VRRLRRITVSGPQFSMMLPGYGSATPTPSSAASSTPAEFGEDGLGGELGIEDQQRRVMAGHLVIIEACRNPPVVVIGLSMGSLIAQEMCLSCPPLVRCGIAMGISGAHETVFGGEWMRAEVAFRRNGGSLPEDVAIAHYGVFIYPSEVLGDPDLWARVRPIVANAYGRPNGAHLAAQWEGCADFCSEDRLPGCTVPLHVIGFSQGVQAPPRLGKRVAELACPARDFLPARRSRSLLGLRAQARGRERLHRQDSRGCRVVLSDRVERS
jgi:pimeloyl-ACP methyl ester carboxylesterase